MAVQYVIRNASIETYWYLTLNDKLGLVICKINTRLPYVLKPIFVGTVYATDTNGL